MRIGIVGAGSMGAAHAAAWQRIAAQDPEIELAGVAAAHPESAAKVARDHDARVYDDLDALLAAVDVVDLCVPTDLHAAMATRAAEAKVHVVVEKPLALTLPDADRMIAACERAGVRLFAAMVVRFFPQYRRAADLLAAGHIGRPAVIRLRRVAYPPGDADAWYHDPARSGGMPLDLMIHDLDVARWWGGAVERVYARARRGDPGTPGTDLGDYAIATLRHAGGAMSQVEGGWAYPPGTFRTAFDVAGDAGLVEWDSDTSPSVMRRLAPTEGDGAARVGLPLAAFDVDPYEAELRHACEAIRSGAPFEVDAADARRALRLALAVRRSIDERRPVAPAELER